MTKLLEGKLKRQVEAVEAYAQKHNLPVVVSNQAWLLEESTLVLNEVLGDDTAPVATTQPTAPTFEDSTVKQIQKLDSKQGLLNLQSESEWLLEEAHFELETLGLEPENKEVKTE